jgi:hypothetical protein
MCPTWPGSGVLVLVGDVVRTGSKYGYQYEQLAEGLMVEIVEQYLAQSALLVAFSPAGNR